MMVVFKNLPRHTCVSISYVIIRSETGSIFSLSESTSAQSLLGNDIMDPDCFERWRSLLLIQVTTRSVGGFYGVRWVLHRLVKVCYVLGHPHKGPALWSVVYSVAKEYLYISPIKTPTRLWTLWEGQINADPVATAQKAHPRDQPYAPRATTFPGRGA